MGVAVTFCSVFPDVHHGHSRLEVEGRTLGQVLRILELRFPLLKGRLVGSGGCLNPAYNILVARCGGGATACHNLDQCLDENDEVIIVSVVTGG
ncbi:MAG: MoaD/ThiS family protein [Bacillota bacterium]